MENKIYTKGCKICGNEENNMVHEVREMMFGLRERFLYLECSFCKCLQLSNEPSDMSVYYKGGYYSFEADESYVLDGGAILKLKRYIKPKIISWKYVNNGFFDIALSSVIKETYSWLKRGVLKFESRVLDVGCGSGALLLNMQYNGFRNLTGIDPYIQNDIEYKCGVKVLKKFVFDLDGSPSYDVIMMHHSFEHMSNPLLVLNKIFEVLEEKGTLIINIPVTGGYAWRKYKTDWVQLDAPRHLFLHSVNSIRILAEQSGFYLWDVVYNSSAFQFVGSEKYLRDIPLVPGKNIFSEKQIRTFEKKAKQLNAIKDGDTAVFYLRKK